MKNLRHALAELVPLFERMGIRYAVMGGIAVRAYGIPRATYDLDFTLSIARDRLPELYRAVEQLGYTVPDNYSAGWVDQVNGLSLVKFRLYLEGNGVDIDVFLAESPFQQEALARRCVVAVDNLTLWLVTPEDLILFKLLAARPRDLADIGDVLFVQGQLDESYLRMWAQRLGILDRLENALAQSREP